MIVEQGWCANEKRKGWVCKMKKKRRDEKKQNKYFAVVAAVHSPPPCLSIEFDGFLSPNLVLSVRNRPDPSNLPQPRNGGEEESL